MIKGSKYIIILVLVVLGLIGYEFLTAINNSDKNTSLGNENIPKKTESQEKSKQYPVAPDFSLYDLNGKLVKLSDYRGKVVIIDFWATWCGPCRMGIPDFVDIQSKYQEDGFIILGISVDQGNKSLVEEFAKVYKINYPVLFYSVEVINAYGGIQGIPTTFIIDRDGRVRDKVIGYRPKNYFINAISSLL